MNLYIIGNGFDLAHELKTSYWDFRCYLERYAETFLVEFEKLFSIYPISKDYYHSEKKYRSDLKVRNDNLYDFFWKDFETNLGMADESSMLDFSSSIIANLNLASGINSIEDTMDEYWEKQYKFVEELQNYIYKWVKQIRLNKAVRKTDLITNEHLYLSFNYTAVLERVYGIRSEQICHIHGGKDPYCSEMPKIGHHNYEIIDKYKSYAKESAELFREDEVSIYNAIAKFYTRLYKDVEKSMWLHKEFFDKVVNIDEIHVIGHSLGEADMPYFERIKKSTTNSKWFVYYYDEENNEKDEFEKKMQMLGITNCDVIHLSNIFH